MNLLKVLLSISTRQPQTKMMYESEHKVTITREMATRFVNTYHATVRIFKDDGEYVVTNYIDEFLAGCIKDDAFRQLLDEYDAKAIPVVQTVYDAIHILMCPTYSLRDNIKYCNDYINLAPGNIIHLNIANKNYHWLNRISSCHYSAKSNDYEYENLSDSTFEPNVCSICQYENIDKPAVQASLKRFYYSTAFGLNMPVCQDCIESSEDEDKAEQNDPDYYPPTYMKNKNTEAFAKEVYAKEEVDAEEEVDSDEEVYAEEEVVANDVEDDDEEQVTIKIVFDYTEDEDKDEQDEDDEEESMVPELDIERAVNDYKAGWQAGWKAAIKRVERQVNKHSEAPAVPTCDNCGIAGKTKKCGGTCNGCVRYCSVECQTIHWKQTHKFCCM